MAVFWAQLRQLCGLGQAACPVWALWSVEFLASLVLESSLRGCATMPHEDAPEGWDLFKPQDSPEKAGRLVVPISQMRKLSLNEKKGLTSAEEATPPGSGLGLLS